MESLLKLSGLLPEGDGKTDLGDLERRLQDQVQQQQAASRSGSVNTPSNLGRSSSESMRETPTSSTVHSVTNSPAILKEEDEVEALSDQMCSLVTNNCGETRFIGSTLEMLPVFTDIMSEISDLSILGSSSGFSIFSPKGIQWVNEKTGDKSFQQMIMEATSQDSKWSMWKQDIFGPLFAHRGENELPSKEVAFVLVSGEIFSCQCISFKLEYNSYISRFFSIFQCLFSAFSQTHLRRIIRKTLLHRKPT